MGLIMWGLVQYNFVGCFGVRLWDLGCAGLVPVWCWFGWFLGGFGFGVAWCYSGFLGKLAVGICCGVGII